MRFREIYSVQILYVIILLFPGKSNGVGYTHPTSRYSPDVVGHDSWERECEEHKKTLNGTRFTSSRTSLVTQDWPCVDNTSCEIQLSLVEQQQKLLSQKRQASAKLQTSLHSGVQNGRGDPRIAHELSSVNSNRHVDDKYLCSNALFHSSSQQEVMPAGSELYCGVGHRGDCSASVDNSSWNNCAQTNGPVHKPAADISATVATSDKKHAGDHEISVTEDQIKKSKRLQQLRSSSHKSGKLHSVC